MATAKFYLNHPLEPGTTNLKKSEVPIDLKFSIDRNHRFLITTGERIKPKYWDKKEKAVKSSYVGHNAINQHLSLIKERALQAWRDNKNVGPNQLKEIIKAAVKGDSAPQKKTVIEAVKKFIAQYEKEKEIGTVKRYKVLLKKLEAFNPKLTFEQLDVNFYDTFKNWLYDNPNPVFSGYHLEYSPISGAYTMRPDNTDVKGEGIPVGLFDDVVFKYFINLKTVCAWAEMRGYTVHPAYKIKKAWPIIRREYQPIALTQDELHRIEDLYLPEKHLDIARDYLALECRTGQRISDLRRFNKNDINGNRWTFNQKKGARTNQKTVSLPFTGYTAPALLILQKYNYELPSISEQKINEHIKTVCKRAGIVDTIHITRWAGNKKVQIPGSKYEFISTHTGRKTFITITLQFMSHQTVMNITGIRSFQTLKHYAGESETGLVEEGLRKIENDVTIMRKAN